MTKAQLADVAREIDVTILSGSTKAAMQHQIVEGTVGARLTHNAVAGVDLRNMFSPSLVSARYAMSGQMSPAPLLENTWGVGGGPVSFHDDGAIGYALHRMGPDRHLQVDGGDALANVLGRAATDLVRGKATAQQTLEIVQQIRDQAPAGSRARQSLDYAVDRMDAPMTPVPEVPAGTPPALAQLVRDLHAVPLARQVPSKELEPLLKIIDDVAAGRISESGFRLQFALRDLHNRRHESQEGKFEIDAAVERAEAALKASRKPPR
jgi:hypothetical protein